MKKFNILALIAVLFSMLSLTTCVAGNKEQGKDTDDTPATHTHTAGDEIMENIISPTCTVDGKYDIAVYCVDCGEELSRVTETVVSLGHLPAEAVRENEIPATCLSGGSYDNVVYCSACGCELSRESAVIDSVGHNPKEPLPENVIEPVCKTDGSCDLVTRCLWCDTELSREKSVVAAVGHKWSNGKCVNCNIAYSVEESLEFTISDNGEYYIITGIGTCIDTNLVIPSEYKGLPVKEIGNYAFQNCTHVVEAYIPASITRLGYGAAMGCTGLKKLVLEDRKGWELMEGHDDAEGLPIPAILLINTSIYLEKLVEGDFFWLVKTEN